jgi:predicted RNA-binding protein YlxR (DUF448 family)
MRAPQSSLIRLQCKDKNIIGFSGIGRSFYLCDECLDSKNTRRALARQCKTNATQKLLQQLKEIIVDVR